MSSNEEVVMRNRIGQAVAADPEGDPEVIAKRLLTEMDDEELLKILTREIERVQRQLRRRRETEAFDKWRPDRKKWRSPILDQPTVNNNPFAGLRKLTFSPTGDGRKVTWGQATKADHLARIAYLERLVVGTLETIDKHRAAIEELERTGCSCLDETFAQEAAER